MKTKNKLALFLLFVVAAPIVLWLLGVFTFIEILNFPKPR